MQFGRETGWCLEFMKNTHIIPPISLEKRVLVHIYALYFTLHFQWYVLMLPCCVLLSIGAV